MHQSWNLQNQHPNGVQSLCKSVDTASDYYFKSSSNSDIEELMNEPQNERYNNHQANDTADMLTHETINNAKKTILTGMTLTESSSSGSVTDSVCTTYEHQGVDTKNVVEVTCTSTIAEAGESDEQTPNKPDETSTLSTMLGGRFDLRAPITIDGQNLKFLLSIHRFILFDQHVNVTKW